ncbi:MAG: T9SS type A sorting domain-containing protein, partial [Bacteroidales bacterium]|nr:T9SS type A sorting domain-containing protein [Bacteroidales bacterium]
LNSPLQKAQENGKIYITGLASDRSGNLWIVQPGVSRVIKVLKSDGTWIVNPLTINAPSAGDILISSNGLKMVLLSASQGLLILDDNNTPDLFADDRYNNIAIRDNEDNLIRNLFSIAEDLTGNIWIGTDKGPVVFYNNEDLFGEDPRAFRIKIPRNDGSGLADYLLGNETVTAVAIDGANRKWLGTKGSGAYLLSSDETSVINNYNLDNSPLYSNFITSIAVDNISGDVWFGTGEGVISIRGEATEGSVSYKNVYAFPNPVRDDYNGNVTITGLMSDSRVIITDISGNLVFKTISTGGQASWDLTTYNGRRVTTGVYLIFCSNQEGSKAFVTKVLVIR